MKTRSFKHVVILCGAIASSPVQAQLGNGLVSYYDFEVDFANHITASGPDGTAMNGALAGVGEGRSGHAMQVSTETNQHMNLPFGYGEGNALGDTFTISAWYNLDTPPAANATSRYFVFEGFDAYDVSYGIRDLGLGEPGIDDGQVYTEGASINSSDAALSGWNHVLQTYTPEGTNVVIRNYINGVAIGSLSISSTNLTDSGINFGAARGSQTNRGFDGLIDEVAIWDRVLTSSEITSVYALGLNSKPVVDANPPETAPTIVSFTADPAAVEAGSMTTLSWEVTGATSVTLSRGIGNVALADTLMVTVGAPTTYTLVAINENSIQATEATITTIFPPADLLSGLVGYYDGEDNNNDPAASDSDALSNIGVEVGVVGGVVGNAFQFDNTPGDTLTASTSYSFNSPGTSELGDTFTVAAWYNLDTDAPLGNGGNRHFVWENTSDFDFSYWIDNDGGPGSPTGVQAMYIDGTTNLDTYIKGTWQHVAQTIVSSGGTTTSTTYIDGILAGSASAAIGALGSLVSGLEDSGVNFGRARTPASDRPFDGLIDEIGIWSRALSEEEIKQVFALGSNGSGITGSVEDFAITRITYDADTGDATIEFVSVAGATYAIDSAPDLLGWDELNDNFKSTSDRSRFTDNTSDPRTFYRVRRIEE